MTLTKKLLTAALAASALTVGSLAVSAPAMAKGWHHHHHHNFHWRWNNYRFTNRVVVDDGCYYVKKRWGRIVKICPID